MRSLNMMLFRRSVPSARALYRFLNLNLYLFSVIATNSENNITYSCNCVIDNEMKEPIFVLWEALHY